MSTYDYSIANDFNVAEPSLSGLQSEVIADPGITVVLTKIDAVGDDIIFDFISTLPETDETALDAVVANHGGKTVQTKVHETVMIATVESKITSANDWYALGGVILAPTVFDLDMTKLLGQVTGQFRSKGAGAELNLNEQGEWNQQPAVDLMNPSFFFPDSQDAWLPFAAKTNVLLRPGYWAYVINAKRNASEQFYLRYLTVSSIGIL